MSTLLTVLIILGSILVLGILTIIIIVNRFDKMQKDLEELTHLDDDDKGE